MKLHRLVLPLLLAFAQPVFAVGQKSVGIEDDTQQQLQKAAISLLRSSSLHSGPGADEQVFPFAGVHQDYRDAVSSGAYVVVRLSPVQGISTSAGEIRAAELVVGLRSSGERNCVFTIDDHGVLTCYAKYSGELMLKLKKVAAEHGL
jgi:hypothetical protein